MAKTTFQAVVRSHGGQDKSATFPGTVVLAAEGIVDSSTSVYSAVTDKDGTNAIVLPSGARIVDVTHVATGAADKNINLGTTTTAANANATSIATALSANGFNSAIVDDVDGAAFLTPLTANSTVYGAGAGSSTTSSTTKVMIYYTISDNGKPSESEPVLS